MAKQVGPVFFTGTMDGIIFYKLGDKYYSRSKGSYKSAKHMRRNPKYKRTMEKAEQFGNASNLLQEVYYRYLPKAVRKHGLYGKLTGLVNSWLQQGKGKAEVKELLIAHCQQLAATVEQHTPPAPKGETSAAGCHAEGAEARREEPRRHQDTKGHKGRLRTEPRRKGGREYRTRNKEGRMMKGLGIGKCSMFNNQYSHKSFLLAACSV